MSIDRFTRLYHLYTKKKGNLIRSFIRVCLLVLLIGISSITNAQTVGGMRPSDDFDGDGIINSIDLDDDNDGILDIVESNWCKPLFASTIIPVGKTYGVTAASFGNYLPAVTAGLDATTCMSPGQVTTLTYEFGKTVNNVIIAFYGVDFAKEEWFDLNDNPVQLRILDASAPTSVTNNILTLSTSPVAGANTAATSAMGRVQVIGNVTGLKVKHTWLLTASNCDNHGFSFLEPTECLGGPDPDADNDGIPNRLDLDSDGDGCTDALEAGVSGILTTGTVKNGLYGAVKTTTANVASAIAAAPYGSNGLADGVETATESGVINYTSKYDPLAISKNLASCRDSDGDGIFDSNDIDDDNDGVVLVNNDGTLTYTPAAGFVGTDSLIYSVCDNSAPLPLCKTAVVYYTVNAASSNNATIAADDFAITKELSSVSGNVLSNDKNTAGASLKVTSIPTVPASKGIFQMNTDGTYVFTPADGFTGTLDLIYTVCGGTPEVCVNATLHILVEPILRKKVLDITKVANSVKMNLDGSFNIDFIIKIKNLTPAYLDSILVKDDLTKVFTNIRGLSIVSVVVSGKLVKNNNYDGILNTDLLSIESALDQNKEDSIILTINIANNLFGIFANTAVVSVPTNFGPINLNSTDPTTIVSPPDSTRKPTLFKIPLVEVIIPGGFSPNNDGIDDAWIIKRPFGTKISVQVFNRWGNEVYANENYFSDWRGKGVSNFMGEDVVEGTYFYIVLATDIDGVIRKFAGSLTIVR